MQFSEWFDVKNTDHLRAYRHLQNTGAWPVGFIPSGMEMEPQWQFHLLAKLADAYLDMIVEKRALDDLNLEELRKTYGTDLAVCYSLERYVFGDGAYPHTADHCGGQCPEHKKD